MKRSSSTSEGGGNRLFSGVFARGDVARCVSDEAWLEAMLDVEGALARALARAQLATPDAAAAITAAARAADLDVARIGAASASTGSPVVALVEALRAAVSSDAAATVHRGATSQDVLDTAMMLIAKRAGAILLNDLAAAADAAALLVERHRGAVMVGRTLLQQAVPVTFGLKAAGWLTALDAARTRLADLVRARLPIQFGGASGTLASLGDRGVDVAALLAEELGLAMPVVPWHTLRLTVFELASALAGVSLVLGKTARDVTLLAQSEVAEVSEAGDAARGGSSTMPQKRNPVAAVAILGCARRVPGLLATLAAAGEQEHERAAGAWHAEWEPFADLVRLTGSAAAWSRELLEGLKVDPARMRTNLEAAGGIPLAEHLSALLAPTMGPPALDLVKEAVARARRSGRPLLDALFDHPATATALANANLDRTKVTRALEPESYLGSTQTWIDRALAAHGALRARERVTP
jgi:3-carboxy-cis,cis-muconate cycloisomerase